MRWFRRRKFDTLDAPQIIRVAVGTLETPKVTFSDGTLSTPVVTLIKPLQTPVISVTVSVVDTEQTGQFK